LALARAVGQWLTMAITGKIPAQLPKRASVNPLSEIKQIDYTVIFARDMAAMRRFYETVMEFPLHRTLSDKWIEYRVGANTLALAAYSGLFDDAPPPKGALSLQLAFRVAPDMVAKCALALEEKGVRLALPLTDQALVIAPSSSGIPTAM
jgi:catechol 2,3-dioxygenase-like lactoylglutathione lyase family enzyme